jgi:hypothetical protein
MELWFINHRRISPSKSHSRKTQFDSSLATTDWCCSCRRIPPGRCCGPCMQNPFRITLYIDVACRRSFEKPNRGRYVLVALQSRSTELVVWCLLQLIKHPSCGNWETKRYLKFPVLTSVMATNTLIVVFGFWCDVVTVGGGGSVFFRNTETFIPGCTMSCWGPRQYTLPKQRRPLVITLSPEVCSLNQRSAKFLEIGK